MIVVNRGVDLPQGARNVIQELLKSSGALDCTVTSAARSPFDQARVMYDNCLAFGPVAQERLYKGPGREIIDVYKAMVTSGWAGDGEARDRVIEAMERKILEVGPRLVSHHCLPADSPIWVIDIAPASLVTRGADYLPKFLEAAKSHPRMSKVLEPPQDPAVHLEITKAQYHPQARVLPQRG